MTEAVSSSETSVNDYETARRNIREVFHLQSRILGFFIRSVPGFKIPFKETAKLYPYNSSSFRASYEGQMSAILLSIEKSLVRMSAGTSVIFNRVNHGKHKSQ
jgi:hypothetical protein